MQQIHALRVQQLTPFRSQLRAKLNQLKAGSPRARCQFWRVDLAGHFFGKNEVAQSDRPCAGIANSHPQKQAHKETNAERGTTRLHRQYSKLSGLIRQGKEMDSKGQSWWGETPGEPQREQPTRPGSRGRSPHPLSVLKSARHETDSVAPPAGSWLHWICDSQHYLRLVRHARR